MLLHTRAQGALTLASDGRVGALRQIIAELLQYQQPLRHLVGLMYGLDACYDSGIASPHPLAGRWAPNLALTAPGGAASVAELMYPGRGVLLDLTPDGVFARAGEGWCERVDIHTAQCADPPASALLIRPDGYVAWAAAGPSPDETSTLREALSTWFGTPAAG